LPVRRSQRLGLVSEAVVQDRGRPVRARHRAALSPPAAAASGWPRSRVPPSWLPHIAPRTWGEGATQPTRGRLADRVALRDQGNCPCKVHPATHRRWRARPCRVGSCFSAPTLRPARPDPAIIGAGRPVPSGDPRPPGPIGPNLSRSVTGCPSRAKAARRCRIAGAAAAAPSVTSPCKAIDASRSESHLLFRRWEGWRRGRPPSCAGRPPNPANDAASHASGRCRGPGPGLKRSSRLASFSKAAEERPAPA